MMQRIFFSLLLMICATAIHAQKKNLSPEDYGKWQTLASTDISPDGVWVSYLVTVLEDNDTLYVVNRATHKTYKMEFALAPEFSRDNKWVAYRIGLPFKEAEKLRDQGKPIEYKMGLLNLETGKKEVIQNISRFAFSRNGKFLAAYLTPPKENKDKGSVLLVKDLTANTTHTIGNVTEYSFNKKSDYLGYIVESANVAGNSVELLNLGTYNLKIIASDTLKFSKLTWQKEGEGLSFYQTFKKDTYEEENAIVFTYRNIYQSPSLVKFDPTQSASFPKNMRIHNGANQQLSDDMSAVFFGIKPWTLKPKKDDKKIADSSKAKLGDSTKVKTDSSKTVMAKKESTDKPAAVDIWHWKDPEIQPTQKLSYTRDKEASLLSVFNFDNNSFYQLAKEETPDALVTGNQKYVITSTDKKYKPAFKEDHADFHLVNTKTGEDKLLYENILDGFYTGPRSSPDGKYLYYFKDKNWWVYNIATAQNTNITQSIKTNFWNTRDDHPATKPPVGFGGWLKDDKALLVYDEYNTWSVKPDGTDPVKITNGEKDEIVHRVYRVDFEDPFLDDSKPIFLSTYGDKTKKFGYSKLENGKVSTLVFENYSVSRLTKAKDVNAFTWVVQDYDQSPALQATDNFEVNTRIMSTNPQQANYNWGKSQLITYTNKNGKKLQGSLFYPANYEAGKQYPMVVYIYEILSNGVHNYVRPGTRSAYNTTNFTTNGYFIFQPDIVYETNDPGMSAVNCVVPAVKEVLKTGMIDKDKVGIMGHSWGAYQTAFLVTQTDVFKAASAGAPLTDLISMSLSIYWNSGTPDQKIFETSQGRFDGPWYERTEAHIRNSPMFNAAKIKAPLLVAFGDKDGAVDWHQGIEMYGTMRRMEKPHVMLVYADENHGLAKKENQIDYQKRQKEWFDHYLLGKPAEKWITEGVSYLDKMKEREKAEPK